MNSPHTQIMKHRLVTWINGLEDYELQDVIDHLEDAFTIPSNEDDEE